MPGEYNLVNKNNVSYIRLTKEMKIKLMVQLDFIESQ